MGKKRSRKGKAKAGSGQETEDSDLGDEDADLKTKYGTIGEEDDDFYEDEVDKFHNNEDKILLDKAGMLSRFRCRLYGGGRECGPLEAVGSCFFATLFSSILASQSASLT